MKQSFKTKRRVIAAALILALTLILCGGCGRIDTGSGSGGGPQSSSQTGTQADSGALRTVTDCLGREVEIPEKCERIAALDSFAAEAMVMTGAGEQMCTCPNGTKSDTILQDIYPALPDVPVVKSQGAINIEGLAALSSQVVFIKSNAVANEDETAKLDKLGIPYLAIGYETMEEQIAALELIGEVCGGKAQDKMKMITDYYSDTIDLVKEHAAKIPEKKRLRVYHGINEIARTDGKQSIGADWIGAVGAVNVSAGEDVNVDGTDYQATLEQIYAWDPDVVICNAAESVDYLYSDSKWKGFRAVKEKQVKAIPIGATRWGQRGSVETYFAMLWLGCEIYPKYYEDVDLKKEVVTFYKNILGIEVNDELYDTIISGRGIRNGPNTSGGGQP